MNQLVVALLFLSVPAHTLVGFPPSHPLRPYTVITSTKAAFAKLPSNPARDQIVEDTRGLTRKGTRFTLQLTTGKQLQLVSKPGPQFEVDMAELSYLGKLPYLHKYCVQVSQWESSIFLLIDQRTGAIDTLQGYPNSSPTLQRLAVAFQTYPMGDGLNGVDVYTVQQSRVQRLFQLEQAKWIPYGLRWRDNRTFILKCLPVAVEAKLNSTADRQRVLKRDTQFFYLQVSCK